MEGLGDVDVGKTIIVFIGPAGAGKSSLVHAYSRWLEELLNYRVYKVNLDPAAEYTPYTPDFDARSIVNIHKIAIEYGLGPNGALVKAMDVLASKISIIEEAIRSIDLDFVLVDTPGQMEIFIFRDIAVKLADALRRISRQLVVVFVVDAEVIRRYEDYAFISVMSVAIQSRLGVDVIPIINKVDLEPEIDVGGDLISDISIVTERLKTSGVYGEMMKSILNIVWLYSKAARIPKVSAKMLDSMEELHRIVHELTCSCGDLT
ncbi:MAG: ATP/GTP-binding protein [Ignisphaera sp.]|nr:ATP/GTP-binding protein [Ignisphaera sp.]MCX8168539.1 ATP/GTP-binding protein [Ignisphaera sp.]MDW8085125.1 ATP/GTP-binding protein [Ignisphaera sp.]